MNQTPDRLRPYHAGQHGGCITCGHLNTIRTQQERIAELEAGIAHESHDIEQALGAALGYPWYKDDPANFPDATEANGVCVGEHVPATLAMEAAERITKLEAALTNLLNELPNACSCHEDYRKRGLIAPDCHYHDVQPEMDAARAVLEGR